jgi:hypothetical protein
MFPVLHAAAQENCSAVCFHDYINRLVSGDASVSAEITELENSMHFDNKLLPAQEKHLFESRCDIFQFTWTRRLSIMHSGMLSQTKTASPIILISANLIELCQSFKAIFESAACFMIPRWKSKNERTIIILHILEQPRHSATDQFSQDSDDLQTPADASMPPKPPTPTPLRQAARSRTQSCSSLPPGKTTTAMLIKIPTPP